VPKRCIELLIFVGLTEKIDNVLKAPFLEPFFVGINNMLALRLYTKTEWFCGLWLLCVAAAFFYLLYPLFLFDGYTGKRELQVILTLVCQMLLLFPFAFQYYILTILRFSFFIKLSIVVILFSGFTSSIFAEHQFYAWGDFLHYLMLGNTVLIVKSMFEIYPKMKQIIVASIMLGFGFANVEFIFLCLVGLHLDGVLNPQQVYPNFGNMRFFNQVHIQLVFIVAAMVLTLPTFYRKYMVWMGGLGFFMLLIGGARGALLSILLVILISSFFANRDLKKLTFSMLKMMLLGSLFYSVYIIYQYYILSIDSSEYLFRAGSSSRLDMWKEVILVVKNNPLGVGPYHYGLITDNINHSHPHNSLLQFTLEWGWAAGVAMIALGVSFFLFIIKLFRQEQDVLILATACSLLAASIYSLLSGVLVMPASQITFVFLMAYLLSCNNQLIENHVHKIDKLKEASVVSIKLRIVFLAMIATVSIFYLFYVIESSQRTSPLILAQPDAIGPLSGGPRMWVHGGIIDSAQ
jgi:hypothetical protein